MVSATIHRAARIDDAILAWRERRGRKRGWRGTVVPYTGYGSTTWVRVLCRVLLSRGTEHPQTLEQNSSRRIRGWRSFITVPVVDAEVIVTVAGVEHRLSADRGGLIDAVIPAELAPGWQRITLATEGSAPVPADVFIVDPAARFGVICDVDDTVMVTALPRPLVAAWNTFVLDEHARVPVPGMAVFLDRMVHARPGSPIIYLSTGAWNVAPTLNRFMSRNLYPAGALLLTDWGPTVDRWFRSGRDHKVQNLDRLASEFPNIRWLLVGDDGQHDEDLYRDFSQAHPGQVRAIAIRRMSTGEAVLAGGRSRHDDAEDTESDGVLRLSAPDGAGLLALLKNAHLPD
ncbi:DUF2183 domain-containing protein [Mycetocola tolaasinivorans]|uniref:DUF2183 domain-containing protein n=1 Tax=Mycetocola tolaasinivorans TaxID=76635 RepID=A0A3L7A9Q7_9MICO|nr:phosphatase domain-containing protein [Mycetocola tolaasinivorans]RLP77069.1 DUF2183 domain-containing protein [Mycetocola tolaasinivorans]